MTNNIDTDLNQAKNLFKLLTKYDNSIFMWLKKLNNSLLKKKKKKLVYFKEKVLVKLYTNLNKGINK